MADGSQFTNFERLAVGDEATLRRVFTADVIDAFAALSGDTNPLHVDAAFAARTRFRQRVAHGMLSAAYVSSLVGTKLPGPGALWFQQEFDFPHPVLLGDTIDFVARIEHKSPATRTVVISVQAINQHGVVVLKGQGKVMVLDQNKAQPDSGGEVRRVALVTGASRGIGASIALALARAGSSIVVNYHRSERQAHDVVDAINRAGGEAIALAGDVADAAAVRTMVDTATSKFARPVEILVNNASGPTPARAMLDSEWADVDAHLSVQLRGAFNCLKAVAPGMVERGRGHIINIGSTYHWGVPPPNLAGYVMAKAALAAMTRAAALELGPKGLRVNMVSPGMTETDLIADVPERTRKVLAMQTPLRRLALPDDVAGVVAMLCGPAGAFVHGADIPVSGGSVM